MKKIKIIQILNRISKNKSVPQKIRYAHLLEEYQILVYDKEEKEYRFENDYDNFWQIPNHHLNDEVEIIQK